MARKGQVLASVGYPAICKPAAEDASIGIEQRSVVRTARALGARVEAMHDRWDEVVVQRYVDGREVNVGGVAADLPEGWRRQVLSICDAILPRRPAAKTRK